jgi:hypothetical protein
VTPAPSEKVKNSFATSGDYPGCAQAFQIIARIAVGGEDFVGVLAYQRQSLCHSERSEESRFLLPLSLEGRGSKVRVPVQRALSRALQDSVFLSKRIGYAKVIATDDPRLKTN